VILIKNINAVLKKIKKNYDDIINCFINNYVLT
jgi:hypothetical protein